MNQSTNADLPHTDLDESGCVRKHQGQLDTALSTLKEVISKFPKFSKLFMIQGQIHQTKQNYPQARAAYAAGLNPVQTSLYCGSSPVG